MRFTRTAIHCIGLGLALCAAPFVQAAGASSGSVGVAPGGGAAEKPKAAKDEGKKDAETEAMKAAMAKKVSFEFDETPVAEAVGFIDSLISATFIIDPKLRQENKSVSLKVTDMSAREALTKIAAQAGAKVYAKDGVYYIGTEAPESAQKAAQAPAKLTAEQAKAVEAAIKDLGSEDFATREAASKAIAAAGTGALPILDAALQKTDDPEAQSRLKQLADAFRLQLGGDEGSAALNKALERKISFEFTDTPLSDAVSFLDSLVKGTGGKIAVDPEVANREISFRVTDMKLELALEWLAKLADCHLVKSGNTVTIKR